MASVCSHCRRLHGWRTCHCLDVCVPRCCLWHSLLFRALPHAAALPHRAASQCGSAPPRCMHLPCSDSLVLCAWLAMTRWALRAPCAELTVGAPGSRGEGSFRACGSASVCEVRASCLLSCFTHLSSIICALVTARSLSPGFPGFPDATAAACMSLPGFTHSFVLSAFLVYSSHTLQYVSSLRAGGSARRCLKG